MSQKPNHTRLIKSRMAVSQVSLEEVNRVLEVGRLLFSVLKEEEIDEFERIRNSQSENSEIGNAGVT